MDDDQEPLDFMEEEPTENGGEDEFGEGEWDDEGEAREEREEGEDEFDDEEDEEGERGAPRKMTSRQMAMQSGGSSDLLSLPTNGMPSLLLHLLLSFYLISLLFPFTDKRKKSNQSTEEAIRRKTTLAENRKKRQENEAAKNKVYTLLSPLPSPLPSLLFTFIHLYALSFFYPF